MKFKVFQIFSIALLIIFASVFANAQVDASTPNGTPRKDDLPKGITETLKKHEIERSRKNHEEMVENGEEAARLSEELAESFEKTSRLSSKDLKKLEQIEKIVKKIRNKLGGAGELERDEIEVSSLESAVKSLRKTTGDLLDELKKTTRYTISVIAIQSSNSLLGLVRLLRFWK